MVEVTFPIIHFTVVILKLSSWMCEITGINSIKINQLTNTSAKINKIRMLTGGNHELALLCTHTQEGEVVLWVDFSDDGPRLVRQGVEEARVLHCCRVIQGCTDGDTWENKECHDYVMKWEKILVTGPLWGESPGHRLIPLTRPVRGALM